MCRKNKKMKAAKLVNNHNLSTSAQNAGNIKVPFNYTEILLFIYHRVSTCSFMPFMLYFPHLGNLNSKQAQQKDE